MSDAANTLAAGNTVQPERHDRVRVWDPLVRIFHWSLVSLFLVAYATSDEWRSAHVLAGYTIGGLVAFRVLWGFVGSHHARFSNFIFRPRTVIGFLGQSARMRAPRHLGHNPAGGAMVVALLVMIGIIVTSGYMMTTDTFWGVPWVQDVHETAVNVTLGLVVLHLAGVLLASIEHRENLVSAMLTGLKRRH